VVVVGDGNPFDLAAEVTKIVVEVNNPPLLFAMGDDIAAQLHPATDEKPYEWLEPFGRDQWFAHIAKHTDFVRMAKGIERLVDPPSAVARIVPVLTLPELPRLDGIVHTPYLTSDGGLVTMDGYDPATRLYLATNGFGLPLIPQHPTEEQLREGVELLQEWLADFPFKDQASKAIPIAFLLTLTGRGAFFDLSPLFVNDASTPGSGKGLLIHTCSVIATGSPPYLQQLPSDEAEQRKKISSVVLEGNNPIVWDETHVIKGHALALLLTAEYYTDRLLGVNKMLRIRNTYTQVASGNNVQVWGDLKRRVVVSRLEPDDPHPEHRSDFKHPDLKGWVAENRPELLAAPFTMWRYWLDHGKPQAEVTMGSFERWAANVGGCLECAGIEGFLSNTAEWLVEGNPDDDWEPHLVELVQRFGLNRDFTVKQVARYLEHGFIESLPHYNTSDPNLGRAIGNAYRAVRGRWWGDLRLLASLTNNARNGAKSWRVVDRSGTESAPSDPVRSYGAGDEYLSRPDERQRDRD
jgi:hypothetical protein